MSLSHKTIPDGITIDCTHYEPMVIRRNGVALGSLASSAEADQRTSPTTQIGAAMETMTQPKITGYRQLNEDEAALMNEIKALGASFEGMHAQVGSHLRTQATNAAGYVPEIERIKAAEPQRWAAIAKTHMQEALMALTRAVAQPGSF